MQNLKTLAAAVLMLGTLAAPAFAANDRPDSMDGFVTIISKSGATHMMVSDKSMLDEIVKGAPVLDDHTMIVSHNGKMYLVKDRKMTNGQMISAFIDTDTKGGHN